MKNKLILTLISILLLSPRLWAAGEYRFSVTVELDVSSPHTQDDYDGLWHNADFIIYLMATDAQSGVKETYYKINGGEIQSLSAAGMPHITAEGDNNILEYWSVDEFGNEELPHNVVSGIKLDKTPPAVEILSPADESAFDESHLTVTGTAGDVLSGIEEAEVIAGDEVYYPVIQADGSFTLSGVKIADGPNNIVVSAWDAAGNEAQDYATVFLGWVLHLDIPYYNIEDYYSGAACCQMILNYIRNGVASELSQEEIYNYGHGYNYSENTGILEMDPKAIEYTLGHFDPYDEFDLDGCGDRKRAYNFVAMRYANNKFPMYIRDIIYWMSYSVTLGLGVKYDELVARPNTPIAAPAYGTYNHWIVINGAATSQNPRPGPSTNLYTMPNFAVYGFWLTDPVQDGIGRDVFTTPQAMQETYLLPLASSDRHNGMYIQVCEPPDIESDAEAEPAEPKINDETRRIIEIAEYVSGSGDMPDGLSDFEESLANAKRHIYDAALVVNLEGDTKASNDCVADSETADLLTSVFYMDAASHIELDWRKVITSSLLTDESFRMVFDGSQARAFIKVKRTDKEDSFYYLIPFDKYSEGRFLTYAAIIVDSENGSFREASWVESPTRFIQVNKEEAIELVLTEYTELKNTELDADLTWEPGDISKSPFYPYWRITSGSEIYYATQNKKVIKENGEPAPFDIAE